MTQAVLVIFLVVLAAAYSAWYLLPPAMRPRLGRLHRWFARTGACSACQQCRGCASVPGGGAERPVAQPIRFYSRN